MIIIRRNGVSDGARALKDALKAAGVLCRLSNRTTFSSRRHCTVINWGDRREIVGGGMVLNLPVFLTNATNKLSAFGLMNAESIRVPKWWTNAAEVERGRDTIILERHTLTGESGAGIVVKRAGEELASAPLYVEYIRKQQEYRVHVFNGKAIAIQQKRRESDVEQTADEALLRNRDNGWVFCIQDIPAGMEEPVKQIAVDAVAAVGLDFGAVDIVVANRDRLPYVLEINTKPGLSSPTVLAAYVEAIKEYHNGTAN